MRSRLVPVLFEHARARGIDADALAERFEVPPECRTLGTWTMDAPPIEIRRIVQLVDALAEALQAPWLGLELAEGLPRGVFGVQEFAVRNAPTLGEAASRLVRYQRLTNDAIVWAAGKREGECHVGFHVPGQPEGLGSHLNVFLLATALDFVRQLAEERVEPSKIRLAHARTGMAQDPWTARMGPAPVAHGAGLNELVFPSELWHRPIPRADAALLPVLDQYATRLVPVEDPGQSWPARVRDHLRRQLSGGAPTLQECAAALRTTPRSLQRWLDEEGTSYRALVDELRANEGRRMVAGTDLPIDEITFLLGYSNRRAFVRAFRRWTGETPGRYRALARNPGSG
ncbi:MAG: AraC family transcriptional regulator ligand-binding domain-containing protein [Myxococcota bacterium]